eukprot:11874911-Karenia_brevis.AAC.1
MPRCSSPSCVFGANSDRAGCSNGERFCSLCVPRDAYSDLTDKGKGALVRIVAKLMSQHRDEHVSLAIAQLEKTPGLGTYVKTAAERTVKSKRKS